VTAADFAACIRLKGGQQAGNGGRQDRLGGRPRPRSAGDENAGPLMQRRWPRWP
jgi:hypothetical protein